MTNKRPPDQLTASTPTKKLKPPPVPTSAQAARAQQEREDAKIARKLAEKEGTLAQLEWQERRREKQQQLLGGGAGRVKTEPATAVDVLVLDDDDSDDDDIVVLEAPKASTSKQTIITKTSPKAPLASIFAPKPKVEHKAKASPSQAPLRPSVTPSKPSTGSFFASPSSSSSFSLPDKPLDTSIYSFDPRRDVNSSAWPGGRVPYSYLTTAFVLVSSTKSRIAILTVLTNLFRVCIELDPASLESVLYLTSNRLAPSYEGTELGIGSAVLTKAIKAVCGITPAALKVLSNKLGDPGDIAFEAKKDVRTLIQPSPLLCHVLYNTLCGMTRMKGSGSQEQKSKTVENLLVRARGEEVRFLVRTLVSNLRIGAVKLTILSALARAFALSRNASTPATDDLFIDEDSRRAAAAATNGKGKGKAKEEHGVSDATKVLEQASVLVRRTFARHPNYAHLVAALLEDGFKDLETRVPLAVGTPLEPMLGSPTRALSEIYTRLGSRPFVAEAKLDGQRGQIHVSTVEPAGGGAAHGRGRWYDPPEGVEGKRIWVRMFSRHLEDMTDKYPDILPTLSAIVARESKDSSDPLTSFVIDCEIVAIDPATGAFRTFQELSYRSRKDVEMGDIKVRVGLYAFDLMHLNGQSLLGVPFRQRRELLHTRFSAFRSDDPRWAKWEVMPSSMDNELDKVKEFFEETLKMRAEGIMVKLLDEAEVTVGSDDQAEGGSDEEEAEVAADSSTKPKSRRKVLPATYEPDKRAASWLKVKKDYLEDLGDSLDLVPIGAWHGNGRKASWWSPILLGAYDSEQGMYTAVCKCMSGFTDAFYMDLNVKYAEDGENTSKVKYSEIEAGDLRPAVWFKPQEVWECRGADFTLSPVYPAAQGLLGGERGVSVRFPRFIRRREDKDIEQATTAEQLAEMYERQADGG